MTELSPSRVKRNTEYEFAYACRDLANAQLAKTSLVLKDTEATIARLNAEEQAELRQLRGDN